tara:strand:- start:364 stop:636 length:273 start_codon:yes stop_codon:yes gene_type:complete
MHHYVYMIKSIKNGRIKTYVGYSINPYQRLKKHNSGKGAKSTRGRNWKIIFKKKYLNKKLALKAEYFIKNNSTIRNKIKNGYKLGYTLCI